MKKLTALLLCLSLTLGCACALADTLGTINMNGAFMLNGTMPEGYRVASTETLDEGTFVATIVAEDANKPYILPSVAFDEMYADVKRLNDLDAEALAMIESTFGEYQTEITYTETAQGTKLMMVKEIEGDVDFVDFYTIYEGYEVEFVVMRSETADASASLSENEIRMAIDFLNDMEFVPVK